MVPEVAGLKPPGGYYIPLGAYLFSGFTSVRESFVTLL